jgi:hypothetical protein
MTLRTKIEEAIGERHVHKIDNSELLDQICTIFEEELEYIYIEIDMRRMTDKLPLLEDMRKSINSLEDTNEKK